MADGGVWTLLSDEQMTALEVDERWYRVYPPLIPEPVVLPPFELIGTVEFNNALTVEADWAFTSDYRNYCVVIHAEQSGSGAQMQMRLKKKSAAPSTSGYVWQALRAAYFNEGAGNTTPNGERKPDTLWRLGAVTNVMRGGFSVYLYGPSLPQPTAMRTVTGIGHETGMLEDHAGTHSEDTAWDGFWLQRENGSQTLTGTLSVYGVRS